MLSKCAINNNTFYHTSRPMERKIDPKMRNKIVAGGHKILDRLGSGSFGEIYRARKLTTGEEVAIKIVTNATGNLLKIGATDGTEQTA